MADKKEAVVDFDSPKQLEEAGAWFWKLFGGTVIGGMTLLLLTILNHLNTSIDRVRTDNSGVQVQIQQQVNDLRDRVSKLEQTAVTLQDQLKTIDTEGLKNRVAVIEQLEKERKALIEEQIKALQSEIKELQKPLVKP